MGGNERAENTITEKNYKELNKNSLSSSGIMDRTPRSSISVAAGMSMTSPLIWLWLWLSCSSVPEVDKQEVSWAGAPFLAGSQYTCQVQQV